VIIKNMHFVLYRYCFKYSLEMSEKVKEIDRGDQSLKELYLAVAY